MATNPAYLSPCGLYCGVCAILIAHRENNQKFKERLVQLYQGDLGKGTLPGSQGLTADDIKCEGCLSDNRFMHCQQCEIRACAQAKGYAGCQECADFPCVHISEFPMDVGKQVILRAIPHIRQVGQAQWAAEEEARYTCPSCGKQLFRGAARCNACKTDLNLD
jgi:predicted RNA-binding Zn-ribbon protein involved in translation (DUF1610 family)